MHSIAKGFSQEITVDEEVFGGFAALPGALAFLARIDGEAVGGCGGRIIPEARIAALFGTATLAGISRPRRAERADCPSAARSLQGRLRVRGGQHQSGQRFAA